MIWASEGGYFNSVIDQTENRVLLNLNPDWVKDGPTGLAEYRLVDLYVFGIFGAARVFRWMYQVYLLNQLTNFDLISTAICELEILTKSSNPIHTVWLIQLASQLESKSGKVYDKTCLMIEHVVIGEEPCCDNLFLLNINIFSKI